MFLTFLVLAAVIQTLAFSGKWIAMNLSAAITVMNTGLDERLSAPMTMCAVHTDLPAKSSPIKYMFNIFVIAFNPEKLNGVY